MFSSSCDGFSSITERLLGNSLPYRTSLGILLIRFLNHGKEYSKYLICYMYLYGSVTIKYTFSYHFN